jgi:hypothetical protein
MVTDLLPRRAPAGALSGYGQAWLWRGPGGDRTHDLPIMSRLRPVHSVQTIL